MDAPWQEVVFHDGLAQPEVALFRAVAVETLFRSHIVNGFVHSLDDGRSQRLRHVADAEADDRGFRVGSLVGIHLLGDVREEIVLREFLEMFVDQCHILF